MLEIILIIFILSVGARFLFKISWWAFKAAIFFIFIIFILLLLLPLLI